MPSAVASASPAPAAAISTSGGGSRPGNQPSWPTQVSPHAARATNQARTAHSKRQPRPMSMGRAAAISRA